MRATKAIIHKENFIHNIKTIHSFLNSNTKLCVTVKANGYGSDALFATKTAIENNAYCVAVATVEEGRILRESGITCPILLLSLCNESEMANVASLALSPFVADFEYAELLEKSAKSFEKKISVHLAVDTGMGRLGCNVSEAANLAKKINASKNLILAGTCTHFSVSDELNQDSVLYTENQFNFFLEALNSIEKEGINPGIRHCSASAASFSKPNMQLDMVRTGIAFYGYCSGDADRLSLENLGLSLKPCVTLLTEVSAIKRFKAGQYISYGRTWKATEDCDIALLPIGYADGLSRTLSSNLNIAINGKNYPLVGRICMDQCMVNLGMNSGVKRWDKAVIFGDKNYGALQDAQDIAKLAGTIPYEILTNISSRVPRVFM